MSSSTAARNRGAGRTPGSAPGPAVVAVALMVLAAFPPAAAAAAGPTEEIRGAIDRTVSILKDPALAAKGRQSERRVLLRKEIAPVFDFEEMAKRSLGPNWRQRTPEERKEFVAVFTDLLENSYLGKIEAYQGEEIRYLPETVDPPYAVVKTVVVTKKGQEVPVHYRVLRQGDRWRIYDVVIEGISLVGNYRSQFSSVLQKSSFDELLAKLRTAAKARRP